MIRVTFHMRDGRQFSVDDVQAVTQLEPEGGGVDIVKTGCRYGVLCLNLVPWRRTIVEGKAKTFSVDPFKVEVIEVEDISEKSVKRPIPDQIEILAMCATAIREEILARADGAEYEFETESLQCVVEDLCFISEALNKEGLSE